MKTLKQFEKSELGIDEFLKPLDRIDWFLYEHILCGYVACNFDDGQFGQNGECSKEKDGVSYYSTVMTVGDKYYFLGDAPSMCTYTYCNYKGEEW